MADKGIRSRFTLSFLKQVAIALIDTTRFSDYADSRISVFLQTRGEIVRHILDGAAISLVPSFRDSTMAARQLPLNHMTIDYEERTILVVDDDTLVVRAVCSHLKNSGFKSVVGMSDPARVVEWVMANKPSLILLDILMPKISGLEILREIRSRNELDDVVVLMLSSAGQEEKFQSLELGAIGFIEKPATAATLDHEVRRMLSVASRIRKMDSGEQ